MKNFLVAALMLFSFASFAQNKFIEVEVTDTITLKPASLRCNIYIESFVEVYAMPTDSIAAGYDGDYDPIAEQEKTKNKLKEIKRKLESKKYKVESLSEDGNFQSTRIYGEDGYSVIVSSEVEVQKLKDLLRDDATVEAIVLKYADEAKAEEQLIKKLIEKAKSKAVIIASHSGLKAGKILEVKEGKGGSGGAFETFMMEMMKSRSMGRDKTGYSGSLEKTFVVKFAAE